MSISAKTIASLFSGRYEYAEILQRLSAILRPDADAIRDHEDDNERAEQAAARVRARGGSLELVRSESDYRDPLRYLDPFVVVDRRDVPDENRPARGRSVGVRAAKNVVARCWHQTAAWGLGPDHPRLLALPAHCHVGQRRDGTVVITLLHRLTSYVYHGHGANRFSVGIEIQARAAGIEWESRTFWRSRKEKEDGRMFTDLVREVTPGILAAIPKVADYYEALQSNRGLEIRADVFHRQTARKPSDPGERIARAVLQASRDLGGEDWTMKTWGKGRPVPDLWSDTNRGVRY